MNVNGALLLYSVIEKIRVHERYVIISEIINTIFAIETLIIIRASIEHSFHLEKCRSTIINVNYLLNVPLVFII